MPVEDEDKYDFDPLDVTKIWPEQLFPLQPVGRMVLNKNPDNFFTENEQIAFCPALVVPGVLKQSLAWQVRVADDSLDRYHWRRPATIHIFALLLLRSQQHFIFIAPHALKSALQLWHWEHQMKISSEVCGP